MADEKPTRRSRINWLVLLVNAGAVVGMLMCYLCAHVPPRSLGYLTLVGLGYPVLLIVNLACILFWILRRRRWVWLSVITIGVGFNHFTDFFQVNIPPAPGTAGRTLKVLTWNVQLFGLYNWENNVACRNAMFDVLDEEKADVLCFQEFYHSNERGLFPTRDSLVRFLPSRYYHERYTHSPRHDQYFGVIIFSRFPIVSRGHIPFEDDANNFCIYADLRVGEDTVRVYNAHLQSIRFGSEDYAFVDENQRNEDLKRGTFRIARKLKRAFVKRQNQVERIADHVRSSPHAVLLCGDFNDPPLSYSYEVFTDQLEDTFLDAGQGTGNTFNRFGFPPLRIDYILRSPELRTQDYRTIREDLSDHFAVVAEVGI